MLQDLRKNDVRAAQRRAVYDFNVGQAGLARRAQSEYGRWLLTALLLVHLTALVLVAQGEGPAALMRTGAQWTFLCGAGFALSAGLMAWINWTLSAIVHTEWADVRLLDPAEADDLVEPRMKKRLANASALLAVAFSLLSLLALPCAAVLLATR